MGIDEEQKFVEQIKNYVTENLPLSKMSDEELEEQVEKIVTERLKGIYCSVEQKLDRKSVV